MENTVSANAQPLISLIVPVYNAEQYIARCVAAVQAQTYTNWELFLVDDESTDNSLALCREAAAGDTRLRVIQGSHAGPGLTRQKGLDLANGEFIYFPDADDYMEPNLLELCVGLALRHDADGVLFGYFREQEGSGEKGSVHACALEGLYHKADLLGKELNTFFTTRPKEMWTRFFRRSYLDKTKCRFSSMPRGEDQKFVMDAFAAEDWSVVITPTPLYHYIIHQGSTNTRYVPDNENPNGIIIMRSFERALTDSPNRKQADEIICKNYAVAVLNKFLNLFAPDSPLDNTQRRQVLKHILALPGVRDKLRRTKLKYINGKFGKLTVFLLGRGAVSCAIALKRFW
ncbi:MAG: glycosyltransferase family 2 protein [Clostridia bacterium]|nr:glycosyltransferase family 2 protein [Clostridia bacterium]